MRDQSDHQLGFILGKRFTGEQPSKQRNAAQARHPGGGLVLLDLDEAAHQVHLSLLEPDIIDDFRLRHVRFLDAAQVEELLHVRNVHLDV